MANADSGINPASRFFNFRWMYLVLTAILWLNLFVLVFSTGESANLAPVNLIWIVFTDRYPEVAGLSIHSVLGFDFDYDETGGPGFLLLLFLCTMVAAFTIPEKGDTNNLPAQRGMHLRAKLVASGTIGIAAAALGAGALDAMRLDMVQILGNLGLMPSRTYWGGMVVPADDFRPSYGIISLVCLLAISLSILIFGGLSFLSMCVTTLGRDRYWQAERWTLLLTLIGLALILQGAIFLRDDNWDYARHDVLLGGSYSSWIVGWMILTFAWTCRTVLLMMVQAYEKATVESDDPSCFACGYDLRMLTTAECPECGTAVSQERMEKIKKRTEGSMATAHAESRSTTR
ncbi:MAG: hypothetical protein AAF085_03945 [Planctomycetota bacterium]